MAAPMTSADVTIPVPFPDGVADPHGQAGYVRNLQGGIDALDLARGNLLWQTAAASRPLLVWRSRLVAYRRVGGHPPAVVVVLLDLARQGEVVLTSDSVQFPNWVEIHDVDHPEFSFHVYITKSDLVLEWEGHQRYRGGAPPPPEVEAKWTHDERGVVHVNLETGTVTVADAGSPISPPAGAPVANVRHGLTLATYRKGNSWHRDPWRVDGDFAAIVEESRGDAPSFYLQRWDKAGRVVQSIRLVEAGQADFSVTADGRYVLVRTGPAEGGYRNWSSFPYSQRSASVRFKTNPGCETFVWSGIGCSTLLRKPAHPQGAQPPGCFSRLSTSTPEARFGNVRSEPRKNRRPRNCVHDW